MRLMALPLVCAVSVVLVPGRAAADWPAWRGPNQDGTVVTGSALFEGQVELEVVWRRPIGSGYSGIAVAGSSAVTMFAEGEADWLAALDVHSGADRWRLRMDEKYVGHDGSEDGPSSTPTIGDGTVYAVGALGRLLAVELSSGELLWERRLDGDFGGQPSAFGFATTPLVVDDLVVVACGGEPGAFAAFDRSNGELRWRVGDDRIEYQSPVLATISGQRVVLALGDDLLLGLAPATGRELFRLDYGPGPRYSTSSVVPVADDRLLLNPWQETVMYQAAREDGAWTFDEIWRETTLDARLATSVWYEGHVYGFDGRFLTCVDGATGEKVWKSRPPGGGGLILVDGRLVILARGGDVVLAAATPDGYRELARANALTEAGVTYPSFAGGRIFVRNTEEIAALAVRRTGRPAVATESTGGSPAGAIAELAEQLERSDTPHLVVGDFMRAQDGFPIVEPDGQVHFVWRGEAEDVGLESSHLDWNEEPMHRLAGTDLWYRSERFDPGVPVEYRFNVDFDRVGPDPANPWRVPAEWGADYSVLALPRATGRPWERAWRGAQAGALERIVLESAILGNERDITVWSPPGHRSDGGAGLLLVLEGPGWIDKGMLLDVLRHRVGRAVAPIVVAFVGAPARGGGAELAGERTPELVAALADELVPLLTTRFGLADRPGARAVFGRWRGAYAAVAAGIERPDVFGHVAAVSVIERDGLETLLTRIGAAAPAGTRFRLAWNRYERWDGDSVTERLGTALREAGHAVQAGERPDSAGWSGWRSWAGETLELVFPAPAR